MFDAVNGLGRPAMFLSRGGNLLPALLSRTLTIAVRTELLHPKPFEQAGRTLADLRQLRIEPRPNRPMFGVRLGRSGDSAQLFRDSDYPVF